ncbi:MAG: carbohydrate kinase [Treponema sp.]|nr:carbohydrate kinase [Treponema sp.]
MKSGILVIDIGMTNKKVAVYDEQLNQLDVAYKNFPPVTIKDPETGSDIPTHDLAGMEAWFKEQIRQFAKKYSVKAISVTTHGATFVCVNKAGAVSAPCVFYTYEPGESFQNAFYELCGSPADLQRETFTPRFESMINLAKGMYFVKQKFPKEYAETATLLNFPQYWSFFFTGKKCYEQTFLGCHTYLWKQNEHEWSSVVDKLGIKDKMPELYSGTCDSLGVVRPELAAELGLDEGVIVTAGVHDSNASLLPYLAKKTGQDFILNSTGTWCVLMHPESVAQDAVYSDEDIGKVVFFNRSALDRPVKTAIFLGGMEVDNYVKIYRRETGSDGFPDADVAAVQDVLTKKSVFVVPEIVAGSGQFPGSKPGIYADGEFYPFAALQDGSKVPALLKDEKMFWAALTVSMVIQTETALLRAGLKAGTSVFTEGGFRKNALYNTLLASVLQDNEFFLTNIAEATATGCAMSALMAMQHVSLTDLGKHIKIDSVKISPQKIVEYESYKKAWLQLAAK